MKALASNLITASSKVVLLFVLGAAAGLLQPSPANEPDGCQKKIASGTPLRPITAPAYPQGAHLRARWLAMTTAAPKDAEFLWKSFTALVLRGNPPKATGVFCNLSCGEPAAAVLCDSLHIFLSRTGCWQDS